METLAKRLERAMTLRKMNQPGLARAASSDRAPVSQQVVHHLLSGRNKTSKHLPALARALRVRLEWLAEGAGKMEAKRGEALLVGYIGAGAKVVRDDSSVLEGGLEPPAGYDSALAARIDGSSMFPLEEGWLVFYESEQGFDDRCINRLSAVGLVDGTVYIKKLRKNGRRFRLESWNAEPIEDAKIKWASRVLEIRPT
jgi:hypothetical protein